AEHASALVLDINTPGGLVNAAFEIRDAMFSAHVPTVAYVSQRAYSAGALIALSARTIVMAPGSSIGAAEPIPNDPKHVSALRAEFASTAARNHRDPTLAAAMVDKSVDAPAFKKSGAILSLTADEAMRAHVTDALAPTLDDALRDAHVAGTIARAHYTWGETLARVATSPEVSGILLSLGVLGLLVEMQTLHGIAGTLGVGALALFFGTHVYAGFSNGIVVALAIAGVLGILFELHVFPGHGVAGTLGAIALVAAIVLAFGFGFIFVAVQAISFAIVLSAICFVAITRVIPESAFFRRIAFTGVQGPDYVASGDHRALVGHTGVATSYLRPAGVADLDGVRVDVLTEGDFLPAGSRIRVSRVEGARIFVIGT
ncbi:MAG: ATP-dependent Clp protease proteolytic subunit, partial [Candidatus Eremiobacteraeota bacterium]|nr:ATP-dependent Clp protease proteolytic subunit [Candidatus Eremiobacteraeota bacterium]